MIHYFYDNEVNSNDYKSLYKSISKSLKRLDDEMKDKFIGIYLIYNENKEIVYIGQSTNIASRLTTHIRGKYKNAYKISVIDLSHLEANLLNSVERFLITKLKPIDNIMVDEKYNINDLDEAFPDIEDFNNLINIETSVNSTVSFLVFPKNKFIVKNDFESSLFLLKNAIKGTEYE